jgi:hypothetical protein
VIWALEQQPMQAPSLKLPDAKLAFGGRYTSGAGRDASLDTFRPPRV